MKEDRVYLLHVRDAIRRIESYVAGGRDAFLADTKTQDAVVRNLEVIGEAVKRLSQSTRDAHSTVPWKQIAGMRDKMIHEYFGVNLDLVWDAIMRDLPKLASEIETILGRDV
ncbi:MAG: HepT-like ribonuclease domain-containing protein [Vicinamibacterales bacterium]